MKNKYPIYIPSKGRYDNCLTADIFINEGLDFKIVVEPQDFEKYKTKYGEKCIVMDKNDQGIAYVRNFIKKYSIKNKETFHWCIDDNIKNFRIRKNGKNIKYKAVLCLISAEKYVDSFSNIGIAGLTHTAFAFSHKDDIGINKQIYSCALIRNDLDIWYRKGLVEDTDYSLQVLFYDNFKWCTLLFHKLLIEKMVTMTMKGGNTDQLYKQNKEMDGRLLMARSLQKQHPDIVEIKWKWGRWQHSVDYSKFKGNKPILKKGIIIPKGVNNYKMELKKK